MTNTFHFYPTGTCSREMTFQIDENNRIVDFSVLGGCKGNLEGIRRLIIGMDCKTIVERLKGTKCGLKNTSCPDQLALALEEYMNGKEN